MRQHSTLFHGSLLGRQCRILYLLAAVLLWSIPNTIVHAYRVGDVVDTDVVVDGVVADALRNQRPRFGIDSKTVEPFVIESMKRSFSLQFEGGLWTLPTVAIKEKEQALEKIQVQFIYTRSGVGAIHALHSNAVYGPSSSAFTVEYQWVADEAVSLRNGFVVMFLAVLVASILFIASSCGMLLESSPTASRGSTTTASPPQQQPQPYRMSSPKWD